MLSHAAAPSTSFAGQVYGASTRTDGVARLLRQAYRGDDNGEGFDRLIRQIDRLDRTR